MMKQKWIAMFSHSGSEIVKISEALGYAPDIIITNNHDRSTWHPNVERLHTSIMLADKNQIVEYLMELEQRALVTLHGYMRIIPEAVTLKHDIINGHPGDIVKYPELKGKDPQEKAIKLALPTTGVVLHKVDAGVDEGPILMHETCEVPEGATVIDMVNILKELQGDMWVDLLRERFTV